MDHSAIQKRILSRVTVTETGYASPCWISNRAANSRGYTNIGVRGRTWLTHRLAYTVWRGEVPADVQLDHLCRQRRCCNPDHLEPVTCRENLARGRTSWAETQRAGVCVRGHARTPDNTIVSPSGKRNCRPCARERAREYRKAAA